MKSQSRRAGAAVALSLALAAAAAAEPGSSSADPLAPLGWLGELAGACWVGTDAAGAVTDRQCYATQYGRFLRGSIAVRSGSATGKSAYRGDSVFAWDAARGRIVYTYWASAGHHGAAEAYYDGDLLVFPPADEGEGGAPRVRSLWRRLDADTFVVVRERREGDQWRELMRASYRREPATGAPADGALAPLAWLAGSCWTGTFADGKSTDLVCYDWMLDGRFLRSRHRVSSDGAPYAGETVFGRDGATGGLRFDYYNVLGDAIRGPIEVADGELRFPSETYEKDGKSFELRSVWRRDGDDRYVAVTERLDEGTWRPFMTISFVRSGPASDWSEE